MPEDDLPFDKLTVPKPPKNGNGDARQPFEPKDVVKLWRKAKADNDQELADLSGVAPRLPDYGSLPAAGLSRLGALLRGAVAAAERQRGVDQGDVGERLWEIADEPFRR